MIAIIVPRSITQIKKTHTHHKATASEMPVNAKQTLTVMEVWMQWMLLYYGRNLIVENGLLRICVLMITNVSVISTAIVMWMQQMLAFSWKTSAEANTIILVPPVKLGCGVCISKSKKRWRFLMFVFPFAKFKNMFPGKDNL